MIQAILSVSVILFSVIDIIGSIPLIINMKEDGVEIKPGVVTGSAGIIMICFLFFGVSILSLFGLDITSFALAGSLIIFFIGLEMTLGIRFFRNDRDEGEAGSIVPLAFPLIAGAGTLTTILSLKTEYEYTSIIVGIIINLIIVYITLRSMPWIAKKMSPQVTSTLRKVFGIILIAIAFQMMKDNLLA